MSEADMSLRQNAVFYQVLKPGAVLQADGQAPYTTVGQYTNVQQATAHAATIPGAAIVMLVCLFINPAAAVAVPPAAARAS